jgi:muconolactone delta-isomerase
MRFAIIYRPGTSSPPPEQVSEMAAATGEWMQRHGGELESIEFFVAGGGIGIIDTDDASVVQRLIAENPFTPYSDIEIRPLIDPATGIGIVQEAYSNR